MSVARSIDQERRRAALRAEVERATIDELNHPFTGEPHEGGVVVRTTNAILIQLIDAYRSRGSLGRGVTVLRLAVAEGALWVRLSQGLTLTVEERWPARAFKAVVGCLRVMAEVHPFEPMTFGNITLYRTGDPEPTYLEVLFRPEQVLVVAISDAQWERTERAAACRATERRQRGERFLHEGNLDRAAHELDGAVRLARETGIGGLLSHALERHAEVLEKQGLSDRARLQQRERLDALKEELEFQERIGNPLRAAFTEFDLIEVFERLDQRAEAFKHGTVARAVLAGCFLPSDPFLVELEKRLVDLARPTQ